MQITASRSFRCFYRRALPHLAAGPGPDGATLELFVQVRAANAEHAALLAGHALGAAIERVEPAPPAFGVLLRQEAPARSQPLTLTPEMRAALDVIRTADTVAPMAFGPGVSFPVEG